MASKECQINKGLEDDNKIGIPELSLDKPHCEKQLDLQNATELNRKEGNMPWEETASECFATFLKEFPAQKEEIEKCIRCLREITSTIDRIHKGCTIGSLVSNSTSAASGILSILGVALAPITAGGSLILTATGIGVGAVATAISLSATLYENIINSKERRKAQGLMNECKKSLGKAVHLDKRDFLVPNREVMGETVKQLVSNVSGQIPEIYKAAKRVKTNAKVWKIVALAKQSAAARSSSRGTMRGSKYMQKAFSGSTMAMSKGARMLSAVSTGVFLLVDVYAFIQDAKHLIKGAKTETAAEIRRKASKFEEELRHLSKLYDELKDLA